MKYLTKTKVFIIFLVFLGCVFILVMFRLNIFSAQNSDIQNQDSMKKEEITFSPKEAYVAFGRGDCSQAVSKFETSINNGSLSLQEKSGIKIMYAQILPTCTDGDSQKSALLLREVLEDTSSADVQKSLAINAAFLIYERSYDEQIFLELLQSPFFAQKNIPEGDVSYKMQRLAEIANDYAPSGFGLLREGYMYRNALLNNTLNPVTDTERKQYAEKLTSLVEESVKISKKSEFPVLDILERQQRCLSLGAIASVDSEYQEKMVRECDGLIESVHTSQGGDINLASIIPYVYFYYAGMLHEIDAKKYDDKIEGLVNDFAESITAYADVYKEIPPFVSFAKRITKSPDGYFFRYMTVLAKNYRVFNQVLEQYSITIPQ